ncbi:Uncharacterised protein [Mycobacteroides abscessus subsp. abscessus]|nr:Uncharacterised protein [Mycobacteroides abscessus subsp. abscessus]
MAICLTIYAIVLHRFSKTFLRELVIHKREDRFFFKIEEIFCFFNIP